MQTRNAWMGVTITLLLAIIVSGCSFVRNGNRMDHEDYGQMADNRRELHQLAPKDAAPADKVAADDARLTAIGDLAKQTKCVAGDITATNMALDADSISEVEGTMAPVTYAVDQGYKAAAGTGAVLTGVGLLKAGQGAQDQGKAALIKARNPHPDTVINNTNDNTANGGAGGNATGGSTGPIDVVANGGAGGRGGDGGDGGMGGMGGNGGMMPPPPCHGKNCNMPPPKD